MIPQIQKVVYLFGDFRRPSNYFYDPSIGPYDYIKMAGGLRESAYKEILIIDPDGRTHTLNANNIFFNKNFDIYPGSIIYAQRDIGKLSGLSYASAVAPILSSLAISLASLNSITND
jgi:protein involved in polysaccharide export with SLBB domain